MVKEEDIKRFANLYNAYCNHDIDMARFLFDDRDSEENFPTFIGNYLDDHDMSKNVLLQKAFIPIKYGYKILNGTKHTTNRDLIIRICLAAEMNLEEVNKCLYLNGMPSLETHSKRDSLIICAVKSKGLKIEKLNDWLISLGFKSIVD